MAFDAELAERVRELLAAERGVDEKRMFGGLAFLVNGHMSVAVSREGGLMVRVPADQTERLLGRPHTEPMIMAGRQARGWLRVQPAGVTTTRKLSAWVNRGVEVAKALPPK